MIAPLVLAKAPIKTSLVIVEITATTDFEYGSKMGDLFTENYRNLASTFLEKLEEEVDKM